MVLDFFAIFSRVAMNKALNLTSTHFRHSKEDEQLDCDLGTGAVQKLDLLV